MRRIAPFERLVTGRGAIRRPTEVDMDKKLLKMKRKLYKQLAAGKVRRASSTRRKLIGLECKLSRKGFQFGSEHIIT